MPGLTPAAIEHQGESLSDFEIACKIGERFGVREEIDKGMSDDMWIETAFQSSRLVEEIDWDTYKEKGYYYPKLEENWEQMAPGMRNFYENPEEYPLDTPTGKIEFWSQALADQLPRRQGAARPWRAGSSAARPRRDGLTTRPSGASVARSTRCSSRQTPPSGAYTCKVTTSSGSARSRPARSRARTGYLYEPLWLAPEDAEARGIEDGEHRQDVQRARHDPGAVRASPSA